MAKRSLCSTSQFVSIDGIQKVPFYGAGYVPPCAAKETIDEDRDNGAKQMSSPSLAVFNGQLPLFFRKNPWFLRSRERGRYSTTAK